MLGIETKLSTSFHSQTNSQIERMNQELEQYLKVYLAAKVSPFIANYGRELKIGVDIRRKGKIEKATEFVERMKKVQKKAEVALRKVQEKVKQQADRKKNKTEEQKKEDKVILSMKDLVFKERLMRKLVDQYIGSYFIEEVVSTNIIKL